MPYVVVVTGSLTLRTLPIEAATSLDAMIAQGASIVVGDAPGGDVLAQTYLARKAYPTVRVFHIGNAPRHNVGGWATVHVRGNFTERDVEMCSQAHYGLALWNGRSRGTARNIAQLGRRMKIILAG